MTAATRDVPGIIATDTINLARSCRRNTNESPADGRALVV